MKTIDVSKSIFKPKAFAYFRQVEQQHETIRITDHGHPVAEIIPYRGNDEDNAKSLHGLVTHYDDPLEPVDISWEVNER